MNKNIKNNDHESFMEGIYGCMERIEAGIIELQKFKQSDSSSVNDNSANDKLVQDLKVLINENNKQGFEYTEAKIKKFAAAVVQDLNILNNNVKDAKSVIVNAQPSTEILNSLNEIKTSQEQKTDEVKTLVQKLKTTIEDGVHNFKHYRIGFETPFVFWTIVIETMLILGLFTWIIISEKPNQGRIDNDLKYRYIKMKGDASAEQIATLEDIFELNRDTQKIEQMREDVETYEEAVRKQAALAEQARLKEQAAKEQESKAKSIKNKQDNSKVNHNKSKP
ncbi:MULTISPECIES: hypothetical protein [Bacteroidales]|jgi:hypothetical protein|nr:MULTISPECIES: hypothetical protein [Bacteroidales]MDC1998539.1 hypothetical protein [Bacteroides uniformis]MDC2002284.1 hypothetical protein [Bacteroides uniformis]MDC2006123.1 hypothetical protein [Bacteroides uniformis]